MISLFSIQFVRKTDPKDRPFLTLAPVDTKFPKLRQLCRAGGQKWVVKERKSGKIRIGVSAPWWPMP